MRVKGTLVKKFDKLLIISHVIHYEWNGCIYAYGPYLREIDQVWSPLFTQILIASPVRHEPPLGDCLPFSQSNIQMVPQPERGGDRFWDKLIQVITLPYTIYKLIQALNQVEAVHIRCPGNLGLLGVILAPLLTKYRVAKYAGQWNGYPGESLANRLQRTLLKSRWWGAPVTVYGHWENQPPHIVPFYTSMMTDKQVEEAKRIVQTKTFELPLRVVYSGRLEKRKRVHILLQAVKICVQKGLPIEVKIVGEGSEYQELVKLAIEYGINEHVEFCGSFPYDEALQFFAWAHCLVLPSTHSEGWPKVVAEAMCYGVIPIAVLHGQLADMMGDRGILVPNGTVEEFAGALWDISMHSHQYLETTQESAIWAHKYSLDGLRRDVKSLLESWWEIKID